MAITPKDAYNKAVSSAQRLAELQVYIDSNLVAMTASGYWHGIDVGKFTHIECQQLLAMYHEKGWIITVYSDQRERTTYWNFRARTEADK